MKETHRHLTHNFVCARGLALVALQMAWGAKGAASVADLVARLRRNDPSLQELHVMHTRKLDDDAYKVQFIAMQVCWRSMGDPSEVLHCIW